MPIMRDIKMTLAAAITAAGISTAGMAQDANADQTVSADNQDNAVVQLAYNDGAGSGQYMKASNKSSVGDDIPKSELKFRRAKLGGKVVEITPDLVKKFAAKGQIKMPVAREEKAVSWAAFKHFLSKRYKDKKAGVIIGVVVSDEPYSPLKPGYDGRDHFREVHRKVVELMSGRKSDGSRAVQGLAELYGAEVLAIIPIIKKDGDFHEVGGKFGNIPLRVDDIAIAINDQHLSIEEDGGVYHLVDGLVDLEIYLQTNFENDRHLYLLKEYVANREKIQAVAREKYGPMNPYIMFTKEYDEFIAKNKKYYGGSSSAGGSAGKSDGETPDVVSVLSHD